MQNIRKWITVSYLFTAAMTWIFFYYFTGTLWNLIELPIPAWFISPEQIVAFIFAMGVFILLNKNAKINQYSVEVVSELAKVTWPERKETVMSTGVISVMVAICAMILFAFDSIWGTVVRVLF